MSYRVLTAAERESLADPREEFASEVLEGLSQTPKRLSSRWFYDDEGSRLFQRIMGLPEYYVTGCEHQVLSSHGAEILAATGGKPLALVDMGAGDGAKTMLLLDALEAQQRDVRYVPIDISEGALAGLSARLAGRGLRLEGVVSEYFSGLKWLGQQDRQAGTDEARLVLFLGSNIGNFDRPRARAFLLRLWSVLRHGDHVLIGFDLKKDIELLLAAYNDKQGVTAAFNLNLLHRINAELGGHFDVSRFRHFSTYNVFSGAMESYLVSQAEQDVHVDALHARFHFKAWEPIHTEYSYKYLPADIERLAEEAGFSIAGHFPDAKGYFVDSLWRVEKERSPA
jgi:L-histidine Nalpha-methyltransferase